VSLIRSFLISAYQVTLLFLSCKPPFPNQSEPEPPPRQPTPPPKSPKKWRLKRKAPTFRVGLLLIPRITWLKHHKKTLQLTCWN